MLYTWSLYNIVKNNSTKCEWYNIEQYFRTIWAAKDLPECFSTVVYKTERALSMSFILWNKEGNQDLNGFEWRREAEEIDMEPGG